jgi:hypothetical protein
MVLTGLRHFMVIADALVASASGAQEYDRSNCSQFSGGPPLVSPLCSADLFDDASRAYYSSESLILRFGDRGRELCLVRRTLSCREQSANTRRFGFATSQESIRL